MLRTRVIPCLLLMNGRLVKTVKFDHPNYVGDPVNVVRIFNTKEVDELVFLDISATIQNQEPAYKLIKEIASECFMPIAYGGGIKTLDEVKSLFNLGIEKVVLNTVAAENPTFVSKVAERYGVQSIIISIDVKRNWLGKYQVYVRGGRKKVAVDPIEYAIDMQNKGAGEILLTSINQDGMMQGYDLDLIKMMTSALHIPVIANGGAGELNDFSKAVNIGGAAAVAAGSMVVYQGKNRAVLTRFPKREDLINLLP